MSALVWFRGRTLRERRLIVAMLALLAVTLVWAGVILPVREGLTSARERHTQAIVRLGEIEARVATLRRIQRARPAVPEGSVADVVRARAAEAGLPLASLDAERPGRVRVSVATARGGALLAWIAGLEGSGVLVEDLTIAAGAPGTVTAQMTLEARSAGGAS